MDETEPRVLGDLHDLPDEVWQQALDEAFTRPLDESLADLITADDSAALDDDLPTGWDDPAYGNDGWASEDLFTADTGPDDADSGLDTDPGPGDSGLDQDLDTGTGLDDDPFSDSTDQGLGSGDLFTDGGNTWDADVDEGWS